jgi:hypothetical protein
MSTAKKQSKELTPLQKQLTEQDIPEILAIAKQDTSMWEEAGADYWKPTMGETYIVIFHGIEERLIEAVNDEEMEGVVLTLENGQEAFSGSTVLISKFKKAMETKQPPFLAKIFYEKDVQPQKAANKPYQLFKVFVK